MTDEFKAGMEFAAQVAELCTAWYEGAGDAVGTIAAAEIRHRIATGTAPGLAPDRCGVLSEGAEKQCVLDAGHPEKLHKMGALAEECLPISTTNGDMLPAEEQP